MTSITTENIEELSRSISVDLGESKRLGALLLSSFQFSVQKLEPFLKDTMGFSLESFRAKASFLSEELEHFVDSLEKDGTLQKCFEDSKEKPLDLNLEASVAEMKEYIMKFSLEQQTWDQLLLCYQKQALLEEPSSAQTELDHYILLVGVLEVSLLEHGASGRKTDELQGSVKQLYAFMDESTQCLQKVSVQLEKRSMQQLDTSPARKLLRLQLQNPPTPFCSGSYQ
ncbi:kinetochore-associated protein DSN1 homolog [Octodon degus]|uniref:Kinetochore-associated protein DSN1 homolog n=1 Tax=Octodon degus TaxID=10160 RepID=A0A6P6EF82_OCTDE|nr:kinetochore-associated protein DSN1 homolog [Octodon degus]